MYLQEEAIMNRFGNRGGGRSFGPPQRHKATCTKCGKECEVPFKPTEGKPVYCSDCYREQRKNY